MVIISSTRLFFSVALAIVIIDQVSKFFIKKFFDYSVNTGAAFGILKGQQWLLILISLVVIFLLIYYHKEYPLALGFILGGAVGNLIDRVFLGYVIDFIDLGFWPSFNVADSFNTVGALLLVVYFFKKK